MLHLTKNTAATAMCAAIALTALSANAGAMSVTDKVSVSLTSPTDQVHWRPYHHRHWGRWHYGWHRGWHRHWGYYPRWGFAPVVYGYSAPVAYGYSAPVVTGVTVAADGNYCATPMKTCLLYEPGWLGTGCSCKVPDGYARGTVVQ